MFGYTFDHPEISDSLVRAALRGFVARLTLNADEVEGRSGTAHAMSTIDEMMRRCEGAGHGRDAARGRTLEIWKQQGQRCAPVCASWNRPWSLGDTKRGPLHAKVFVRGPAQRVPAEKDIRLMVMGSANWTVSSECNAELGVALRIGNEGAAEVDLVVQDLHHGATMVTPESLRNSSATWTGSGTQSRAVAEAPGSRGHRGRGVSSARPLPVQGPRYTGPSR